MFQIKLKDQKLNFIQEFKNTFLQKVKQDKNFMNA